MLTASRFELKLQRIVQEEQEANFISKLYRTNVRIIPWPVIESHEFYALFVDLRQQLEMQAPTHEEGGKFLAKLKMLMAKLKVRLSTPVFLYDISIHVSFNTDE